VTTKTRRIYHRQWFNLNIEIHIKAIKSLRLKVRGTADPIRVSAPEFVSDDVIYDFISRNLNWIAQKQAQLSERSRGQLSYEQGETHYLWGEPKTLELVAHSPKNQLISTPGSVVIQSKQAISPDFCQQQLESFYRGELQAQLPALLSKWQPIIARTVNECRIKKMRTRWGTCNIQAKRIWLSLELAKKPLSCLEYVLVHEMVHLHERNHTKRFYQLMTAFLPDWRERETLLNSNEAQQPAL